MVDEQWAITSADVGEVPTALLDSDVVILPKYKRPSDGKVFEAYEIKSHTTVRGEGGLRQEGNTGDWLAHDGTSGERLIVPKADFASWEGVA